MLKELQIFSDFLKGLGEAAKLDFAWHFVNQEWLQEVSENQRDHSCFFCRQIKGEASRKMLRKCIREHHETEFFQALKQREPFIIHCHAGAMELAVPIILKEEFAGVLCAGTFRSPGKCIYENFEKIRQTLPEIREEQLLAWGSVLQTLINKYLGEINVSASGRPLLNQVLCQDTRILKAVVLMKLNFSRNIKVSEAARAAGMSTSRFLHTFPRETGYSFSDFLQRIRVEHARRLVEGSDLPLSEIAERSGINSQSRMGVLFHRYLGNSPRKQRQLYRSRCLFPEIPQEEL